MAALSLGAPSIGSRALAFTGDGMTNPLTELPLYAGFHADDPAWSDPGVGNAVSSWRNGGTLGTAAEQASGALQPTLTTSATLGGRRVVDFGGAHYLEITSGVSLDQPYEVWAICKFDALGSSRAVVGLQSGSINRRLGTNITPRFVLVGGATALTGATLTPTVDTAYLMRGYANGASSVLTVNGTTDATGDASDLAIDQIILGAGRTAPATYSNHFDGRLAFLGILPAASITAAHRRNFALWAASFYSVPGFAAAA